MWSGRRHGKARKIIVEDHLNLSCFRPSWEKVSIDAFAPAPGRTERCSGRVDLCPTNPRDFGDRSQILLGETRQCLPRSLHDNCRSCLRSVRWLGKSGRGGASPRRRPSTWAEMAFRLPCKRLHGTLDVLGTAGRNALPLIRGTSVFG